MTYNDLENDDLENDDLENDGLENDDQENDDLENNDLENDDLENDDLENNLAFFTQIFEDGSQTFMGRNDNLSHNFLSQMGHRAKKSSYDKTTQRNKEHPVFTSLGNLNDISL